MAKKQKKTDTLNLESILFNCRDYLRSNATLNDKRDLLLTLVFLRFIGEKFENTQNDMRQECLKNGITDEVVINSFLNSPSRYQGIAFVPEKARWSMIINEPASKLNATLDDAIQELENSGDAFVDFDITPFTDSKTTPLERLECLSEAADYIITLTEQLNLSDEKNKPKSVSVKTFFLAHVKRLRTAYDICQPSNVLINEQLSLSQCFMAVASYIRKTAGEKHDTESMNRTVEKMVAEALKCNSVVSILQTDVEENIYSPEFVEQLDLIKLPATKLEVLIKMLRKSIKEYKDTNKIAAEKYEELLNKTLEEYHNRRASLSSQEATTTQTEAVDSIIRNATQQALDILSKLGEDKDSFRKLGLTFEEKAFYDILMHLRDKYNFEYGEDKKVGSLIINDKCKLLAQKIKELIDVESSFTDWLNNINIRAGLNKKIFFCLHNNGYPPQYNDEILEQVMGQVENFKHKN